MVKLLELFASRGFQHVKMATFPRTGAFLAVYEAEVPHNLSNTALELSAAVIRPEEQAPPQETTFKNSFA